MVTPNELINKVEFKLSKKRFKHTMGVYKTASELAETYNYPIKKAQIAALLHDYAKDIHNREIIIYIERYNIALDEIIKKNIDLAHGYIASEIAKREMNICDIEILDAIKYHTIGREKMTRLDKIIYLADYIEPNRKFLGVEELRKEAKNSLDTALLMAIDNSIKHIIDKKKILHPNSVLARNNLLRNKLL